jgi:hypothetical protein
LRTGVSTRSQTNDVYLFKDIANALHITIPTAVDRVSLSLFNKLFPNNQPNPANTEEEYRDAIFDALTEIVDNINQEAGTNIRNARSQKAYTARIVSALGDTVKTFDGAAPRAVRAVVNRVNQQIVQAAPRAEEPPVPRFTEIQKLKQVYNILLPIWGETGIKRNIIDSIINPDPCFADIIKTHFKLKKQDIINMATEWAKTNKTVESQLVILNSALSKL